MTPRVRLMGKIGLVAASLRVQIWGFQIDRGTWDRKLGRGDETDTVCIYCLAN